MEMTKEEIVKSYREAKDKRSQLCILADLNVCKEEKIREILIAGGIDGRQLPRRRKTVIEEQTPMEEFEKQTREPEETSLHDECEDDTENEKCEFDRLILRSALEKYRDDGKKMMDTLEKTLRDISRCVERAEQMLAERSKQ